MSEQPMSEERLAEMERRHAEHCGEACCTGRLPGGSTSSCADPECPTFVLLAEVRRLRAALEDVSKFSDDYGIASAALGRPRI